MAYNNNSFCSSYGLRAMDYKWDNKVSVYMKIEKPVFYKDLKVIFYCDRCGAKVKSSEGITWKTYRGLCFECRKQWNKENYVYNGYSQYYYEAYKKYIKKNVWTYMRHKKVMADSQKKNRHKYIKYYHQYYLAHKEKYRQNVLRFRAKKKLASN